MTQQNSFLKGIKDGLPICIGYFAVSFAFGITAVQCGLSWVEALLISITNLTSAGQLAGVPIIAGGGSLIEMAVSQLVINSRYALMSVSLSQKLGKSIKLPHRFLFSFANTDEVFAVTMTNKNFVGKKYMFGLTLTPPIGWTLGTLFGSVADNILPAIVISALGIAIYGMFVAIVVPEMKRQKPVFFCVIFAVILSCGFYYLPFLKTVPNGFVIIICAVMSSAIFAAVSPVPAEEGDTDD